MTYNSLLPGINPTNTTPVTVTAKTASEIQHGRLAYSIAETALILGISQRSVHRLLKRGLIRGSKALRKIIIARTEIDKFLTETTGEV
jgi:predicted transcriptional regulator